MTYTKKQFLEDVKPVKGAALYVAKEIGGKWCVVMFEGMRSSGSIIESYKNQEPAEKAVIRWQKKENKAVLKSKNKPQTP